MKNIWRIFTRDVCHATRNVIAIIVAMGLIIVPALYACTTSPPAGTRTATPNR